MENANTGKFSVGVENASAQFNLRRESIIHFTSMIFKVKFDNLVRADLIILGSSMGGKCKVTLENQFAWWYFHVAVPIEKLKIYITHEKF